MVNPVKPRPLRIAPSILAANFGCLAREVRKAAAAGADLIHVDVMDGHFVPNISIGPAVVKAVRRATELPFDVHLMIENPQRYIPQFAEAGANGISVHAEASDDLARDIALISSHGAAPCVAINPKTDIKVLYPVLDKVAMVLLMTVNPGFGGQMFLQGVLAKISLLKTIIITQGFPVALEVDGGINPETAPLAVRAGADTLVAGSAIFGAPDYAAAIARLRAAGG